MARQRLEFVGGGVEGDLADRRQGLGEAFGKAGRCIQPGADRGSALRQEIKARQRGLDALDPERDLARVAAEFLAERQRRRIL